MKQAMKHQSTDHTQERKKSAETVPGEFQALELLSPKRNVLEVIKCLKGNKAESGSMRTLIPRVRNSQ